jgi:hypothetical protein
MGTDTQGLGLRAYHGTDAFASRSYNVAAMTTAQYPAVQPQRQQRMTLGAGTAMKIGFFGAFGAFLFLLLVYAILAVIGIALFMFGYFPSLRDLLPN